MKMLFFTTIFLLTGSILIAQTRQNQDTVSEGDKVHFHSPKRKTIQPSSTKRKIVSKDSTQEIGVKRQFKGGENVSDTTPARQIQFESPKRKFIPSERKRNRKKKDR